VVALDSEQLNLADFDKSRAMVREVNPALIVNAAAYTAVDKAEEESELAMTVNGVAPGILAEEAKRLGAAILHYSTDYVFDGTKMASYAEEDQTNPINTYGSTKLRGEEAIQAADVPHLILRTSWVYGMRGRNFLLTILRLVRERRSLR
jgi:dTDP-4-dehydrorhamnose reductase